jgi:hypothetical protein
MSRVEAYYNLHKKCLSYRPSGGKVKHARAMILNDVSLDVQPAGRERVRREGKKNVHAFVRGTPAYIRDLDDTNDGDISPANMERQGYRKITYNPYKYDSFVFADIGWPVKKVSQVVIMDREIWMSGHE